MCTLVNQMDSFKKNYSEFYDTLYLKKNYKREFNLIKNLIRKYLKEPKSLLDLGCGTGKYSYLLTKLNLKVVGLDRSRFMIKIAKKKFYKNKKISFINSDLRNFKTKKKFDIISALFHILSYQIKNRDIDKFFYNSNKILKKNGILIFDFWYKKGVLNLQQPNKFIKIIYKNKLILKLTKSDWFKNLDIIHDNHDMIIFDNKKLIKSFKETHKMRYFDLHFIKSKLKVNKFKYLNSIDLNTNKFPTKTSWGALVFAKKI